MPIQEGFGEFISIGIAPLERLRERRIKAKRLVEDMSETTIPIFPLGLVAFPSEPVPLHIFEPRYRQMIRDCEAQNGPFGIVFSDGETLAPVGCALMIEEMLERMEDGRCNLIARGSRRFDLLEHIPGSEESGSKLYDQARIAWRDDETEDWNEELANGIYTLHRLLLESVRNGKAPAPETYGGLSQLSFTVGSASGLPAEMKQNMLEMRNEDDRLTVLGEHLTKFLPQMRAFTDMRNEIDQKWRLIEAT